jgi:creatinine amidohydrolase
VVYYYDPQPDTEFLDEYTKIRKTPMQGDEHAGERETSSMLSPFVPTW